MKKLITMIAACAIAIVTLTTAAFAASGVSANEQAVLDKFAQNVNDWSEVLSETEGDRVIANQYISEATNALIQVDLDKAACDDLSIAIDEAMAVIEGADCKTKSDLRAVLPQVLDAVNSHSQKYGMTVSVDANGYASVMVQTEKGMTTAGSTRPAINQTGVDTTQTALVIIGILFAVFVALAIYTTKRSGESC